MMRCGLLGRKLGHSYSPRIHSLLGDYSYELFEREPETVETFLKEGTFTGINVTVPYKKTVIPFLDALTPTAAKLGAVNTIVRRDGKLIGHNTDYFGFLTMVRSSGLNIAGKKALVLGSGGASNTAVAVLEELGAAVTVISRTGENHYGNLSRHLDAALIVNTTPVGMYPNTEASPLDLTPFRQLKGVLDVIYNPAKTPLLRQAEAMGIPAVNGLLMLVAQAWEASAWFQDRTLPESKIPQIHHILRQEMENIILIGMPGCGKSTVGRLLAGKLGRTFVDADEELVNTAGKSIPDIFADDGESAFRQLETETLRKLGRESGLVIATGGGCVTQSRNEPLLRQNGSIFWITRSLDSLPTDGRPLSQNTKLEDLYRVRKPLYEAFADYTVCNDGAIFETVDTILSLREAKI